GAPVTEQRDDPFARLAVHDRDASAGPGLGADRAARFDGDELGARREAIDRLHAGGRIEDEEGRLPRREVAERTDLDRGDLGRAAADGVRPREDQLHVSRRRLTTETDE